MPRATRTKIRGLTAAACLAIAAVGASGAPAMTTEHAHAARTCSVPDYPGSGYFTSLTVRHVSCATGRKVTLAHYRCRTAHGRRGHCRHRVLRYSCSEHRVSIPTEIDGRVTCRRGDRRVVYTYQQNT